MSDVKWILVTEICSSIGLFFSTIGNLTLLVLLYAKSVPGIGSYRYLMISFCVFSLIFTSLEFFIRPLMHHYDNTIIVLQRKRFDFPDCFARVLAAAYCGCFAMCFILFAVHFIYRYYVACQPEVLLAFRFKNYAVWVFGIFSIAISWVVVAYTVFQEDEETRNDLRFILKTCYDLVPEQVGHVPYAFYRTVGIERKLRLDNFIGVLHHLTVMSCSISVLFYYGIRTYLAIIRIDGRSQRTRDLQQQFFTALVIQTIIPLVFMFVPNSILTIAAIVDGTFGAWANVTVVMNHLYPAVDPFVIMFVIKGFRNTLTSKLAPVSKKNYSCVFCGG